MVIYGTAYSLKHLQHTLKFDSSCSNCMNTNMRLMFTTAVSEGELTPIEGTRVMGLIDSYRRTLELTEIEERLQALENA